MIEQTLHGLVVGLGKIRKDGSKEFRWLDKPIHNRIVSGGLDYCLTYNGSNTTIRNDGTSHSPSVSMFRRGDSAESSSHVYNWSGCVQFISIGTDGTTTSFNDTGLKSQVGSFSEASVYYRVPYCGMKLNKTGSLVNYRFNYQSVVVDSQTTVREIGFHGKYYGQEVYPLFSRIVLPEPVELAVGEALTVCYQIDVTYSGKNNETEVPNSLLSGLLDSEGNPLRAVTKMPFSALNDEMYNDWNVSTSFTISPFYRSEYSSTAAIKCYSMLASYPELRMTVPWEISSYASYSYGNSALPYSVEPNYRYPNDGEYGLNSNTTFSKDFQNCSVAVADYVPGSYYRDVIFTLNPAWPAFSGEEYKDIYAIHYNGQVIRFGHYDNTDPSNPVWVPKPWRKQFGQSYKFTFRYKLSTADTQ